MPAPHQWVFLQAGCSSCLPTNSVKALKAQILAENYYYYYYYNRFTTLCPGLPRWVGTKMINHSRFCWSRHDGVAMASAEPYASYLHFAPEDNHAIISSVRLLWPDALPDTQPTVSKHWRPKFWRKTLWQKSVNKNTDRPNAPNRQINQVLFMPVSYGVLTILLTDNGWHWWKESLWSQSWYTSDSAQWSAVEGRHSTADGHWIPLCIKRPATDVDNATASVQFQQRIHIASVLKQNVTIDTYKILHQVVKTAKCSGKISHHPYSKRLTCTLSHTHTVI